MRCALVLTVFLSMNLTSAASAGPGTWCRRILNRIFFSDDYKVARDTLRAAFGDDFDVKLESQSKVQLRYLLANSQAWDMAVPHIHNATHLDLSKNPGVSWRVLFRLLQQNASTLTFLDLRGVKVDENVYGLIAYQMPRLQRLRLDNIPWFSLWMLQDHPRLRELDIRNATTPFWYEIRGFIRKHPLKLKKLKIRNHRDAHFVDELRNSANRLTSSLAVRSYVHNLFHVDTFRDASDFARVLDGDTFVASLRELGGAFGSEVSIRLRDMDAPELKSKDEHEAKMAIASRVFLFRLMAGRRVVVDNLALDKYGGRFVGDVTVDGKSVYREMTRVRLAAPYPFDLGERTKPKADWKAIYLENSAFYEELIAQAKELEGH